MFAYQVTDPERYGVVVVRCGRHGRRRSTRSPRQPQTELGGHRPVFLRPRRRRRSREALKPSARGETEIIDVLNAYLARGELTSACSAAAMPGSTPARTTACTRRRASSARSSIAGDQDRLPRGDRAATRLARPRRCAGSRRADGQDRLCQLSEEDGAGRVSVAQRPGHRRRRLHRLGAGAGGWSGRGTASSISTS